MVSGVQREPLFQKDCRSPRVLACSPTKALGYSSREAFVIELYRHVSQSRTETVGEISGLLGLLAVKAAEAQWQPDHYAPDFAFAY